jgi:N-acetylglucosaminyldiphosphoundecaprenol N-acetyl-beta-D-mannosaminyltransferase
MLLGVPIDGVTMEEATDEIVRLVRVGRERGTWHQVTTVNLDFVTNAVHDADLLRILQRAALNLADGMPIVWAARALGAPLPARIAGVDLVDALVARAGLSIYLLGAGPGVAAAAARRLTARYPGAAVLHSSGDLRIADVTDTDSAVLAEIQRADPDILCVALGNPKQERWIEQHGGRLGVPVLIGIGGTLDLIVGHRRRAPAWMQRAGLEWIARAAQEPARLLPRYFRDAVVCVPRFAGQWWRQRLRAARGRWRPASITLGPHHEVSIGAGPVLDLARDRGLREVRLDGADVRVDLGAVEVADARTVAALVSLARAGGRLTLYNVRAAVHAELVRAGVSALLGRHAGEVSPGDAAP